MPINCFDHLRVADLVVPNLRNLLTDLHSPAHKKLAYYFVLDHVLPSLRAIAALPLDQAQESADAIEPHD